MKSVGLLAYKMYSYDTDSFVEEALEYSRDSLILVFDFEKIMVYHKPAGVALKQKTIPFLAFPWGVLNRVLSPLRFVGDTVLVFCLFFYLLFKYRPRLCWIENTYAAFMVGILRRMGLCLKSIYLPGDWPVTARFSPRKPLAFMANNILFPVLDYWACRLNDAVLNHTQDIADARRKLWSKNIAKKEGLYVYNLKIKAAEGKMRNNRLSLCFLGSPREDSGLDLAILGLSALRKKYDFSLKVIGPKRQHHDFFRNLADQAGVEPYVKFLGFVKTTQLPEVLSDGFCGLNLVTDAASYTAYTIPGKIIHYLQYLLPVIASDGIGPMAKIIAGGHLGIVIRPTREEFIDGVIKIYERQDEFRQNIFDYIHAQPKTSLRGMIESAGAA